MVYAENDANVVVAGVVIAPGGVDGTVGITVPSNPGIGSVVGTAENGASTYGHSGVVGETGYTLAEFYCSKRFRG